MNFVIPMAGAGTRFVKEGYTTPKPLLEAHGKTLLEWSVDSLPLGLCTRLVFIGLAAHDRQYDLEKRIREFYGSRVPMISFLWLEAVTRGQAETVHSARALLDMSQPLVIYNVDTAFVSPTLEKCLRDPELDGILGTFQSSEPRFSFAAIDAQGNVVEVVEKEPISTHALTGLYTFRNPADFLQAFEDARDHNETVKGEFYVAPLYQKLIHSGRRYGVDRVAQLWVLGTPDEYRGFLRNKMSGCRETT